MTTANPQGIKASMDALIKRSGKTWLIDDRRERLKIAPFSTLWNAVARRTRMFMIRNKPFVNVKMFWGEKVRVPSQSAPITAEKGGCVDAFVFRLTKFIVDNLKNGDVFVDGGANYGYFSLLAAACGAEVHSLEPTPRTYEILKKNAEGRNIHPRKVALWNSAGTMEFNDFGDHCDGANSLLSDRPFKKISSYPVDTITLDSLNLKSSFIKLDCEGAEYEILKGAERTLENKPILAVEIQEQAWTDGTAKRMIEMLERKGYRGYQIMNDFTLSPLEEGKFMDAIFKA
jgi:FkbM family methyltransferase